MGDTNAIVLSLANGGAAEKEAFVAFVRFRDESGSLILPPYEGFSHSSHGAACFFVSGGEVTAPVVTIYSFTAPTGAVVVEIELRPWTSGDRPLLAVEPSLIRDDRSRSTAVAGLDVHRICVSDRTDAVTLSLANGGPGDAKAFIASVGFLDRNGSEIRPPYEGFAQNATFGAYFYVEGGSANTPVPTTYVFTPPAEAATMEIALHPGRFSGQAQFAAKPEAVFQRTGEPIRQATRQASRAGAISTHLALPSIGSQITSRIESDKIKIVGIIGERLRDAWSGLVANLALPLDGYDRNWHRIAPSHLVIEADQLSRRFGWEHALTLRDPATTVEMAVMLQTARKAGITTVLILPTVGYRFPLLSRVADLFDLTLNPDDTAVERLILN